MNKAKDLRDQSLEELENAYSEMCKKLFVLKSNQKSQKNFAKPHEIQHARKDIARILTVMTEKKNHQVNAQSN